MDTEVHIDAQFCLTLGLLDTSTTDESSLIYSLNVLCLYLALLDHF